MSTVPITIRPFARRLAALTACAALLGVASEARAGAGKNRIAEVDYRDGGSATRIRIRGTRTPTFTVYKLDRPARIVVDVSNATLQAGADEDKATWNVNTWAVGQVSAHSLGESSGATVRLVVGLARSATYKVKADGNDLVVTVTARDQPPATDSAAALERARKAQAEAERARAEAESARASASRARAQATRALEQARAERTRARRAEAAAKKAAETNKLQARTKAEEARRQATAARREADRARKKAEAEADRARSALAEAEKRAELERVRAEEAIATANKDAEAQKRAARELMQRAEERMAEAEKVRTAATLAQKQADAARADADKRQISAARAEREARQARAAADRATEDASRYATAAQSAAGKEAKALQKRADEAARAAQDRRNEAEKAARLAETRRKEAEAAAASAETRRKEAVAKAATAQERGQQAEAERLAAEQRRAAADKAAGEATRRAARARELRAQEEAAYQRTSAKLAQAEKRRDAAEAAAQQLEGSLAAMNEAAAEAEERRRAAEGAATRAERTAAQAGASADEIARARTQAKALKKELARAEFALAKRRGEVEKHRASARQLESDRQRAMAELDELRAEASQARSAREEEEKQLAALAEKRAQAELELAEARMAAKKTAAKKTAAKKTAAKKTAAKKTAKASTRVRNVSFQDRDDAARVVVELSHPARPKVVSARGTRMIIEIADAAIAAKLERTLDTSRFAGPVKAISSYRDPRDPSVVRVVIELNEPAKATVKRAGTNYYYEFAKPAARTAAAPAKAPTEPSSVRTAEQPARVVGGYGASSTPITQKTVAQFGQGQKVYRGTKIDLDFKDADIHNLLRLLADVGGVDIVVPDDIKARVTVRMRRVPWDQALEVILASKGLWYRRQGKLYRIAPRKELDAEDEAAAKRALARAQAEAPEPEIFTLNYAASAAVKEQVTPLLSPKGRIEVDPRTNSLIINDIASHRRRIIDLLRQLDTQTPQIQIEARIVEARSTFVREIGIQWGGSAAATAAGGNATGLIFPNNVVVAGGAEDNQTPQTGVVTPSDFAVNLPAAVGTGSGGAIGMSLGSVGGNFNLALRLSALEDQGSVRIISAPKITVLNNVQAQISQGVSIPISVVSANGVQTQFVPADLSLTVTPYVSQRDCSIAMDLNVTKNEADFVNTGARGDPTILRKEAQTKILIEDGQTTVLGGIYTRNTGLSYSKVPFFGDLPVIGWFFKSRRENDERTEVLVFITPKITNKAFLRCE